MVEIFSFWVPRNCREKGQNTSLPLNRGTQKLPEKASGKPAQFMVFFAQSAPTCSTGGGELKGNERRGDGRKVSSIPLYSSSSLSVWGSALGKEEKRRGGASSSVRRSEEGNRREKEEGIRLHLFIFGRDLPSTSSLSSCFPLAPPTPTGGRRQRTIRMQRRG